MSTSTEGGEEDQKLRRRCGTPNHPTLNCPPSGGRADSEVWRASLMRAKFNPHGQTYSSQTPEVTTVDSAQTNFLLLCRFFQCMSIYWRVLLSLNCYSACSPLCRMHVDPFQENSPPPDKKKAPLFCWFSKAVACASKRKPEMTAAGTCLCTHQTQDIKAVLQVIKTVKHIRSTQKTTPFDEPLFIPLLSGIRCI